LSTGSQTDSQTLANKIVQHQNSVTVFKEALASARKQNQVLHVLEFNPNTASWESNGVKIDLVSQFDGHKTLSVGEIVVLSFEGEGFYAEIVAIEPQSVLVLPQYLF